MTVPLVIKEESSQASGLQDLQLDLKLFSLVLCAPFSSTYCYGSDGLIPYFSISAGYQRGRFCYT